MQGKESKEANEANPRIGESGEWEEKHRTTPKIPESPALAVRKRG
jgi:hypothetical protein